jgi:alanyl-tRNA synthetase
VLEIWNLVFIQFNREANGKLVSLPNKHVDTGMGLERLTSVLQDKTSNYDTEVFTPIFDAIHDMVGGDKYNGKVGIDDVNRRDMAYRVLADHIRTLAVAIADGALPSSEGRGYVIRRILRRALRYGTTTLHSESDILSKLVPVVIELLGNSYPELITNQKTIQEVIRQEEISFATLLKTGSVYLDGIMKSLHKDNNTVIGGDVAFYMYDTLGFPLDLTELIAAEQGFTVNKEEFYTQMTLQKERSRNAAIMKKLNGRSPLVLGPNQLTELRNKNIPPTVDNIKYDRNVDKVHSNIAAIVLDNNIVSSITISNNQIFKQDEEIIIGFLFNKTPFYAESGGQVSDVGDVTIEALNGNEKVNIRMSVIDVQLYGEYVLHTCVIHPSDINTNKNIVELVINDGSNSILEVSKDFRSKIIPNHSTTHALNFALRKYVDKNIDQKGSHVSDERLRFDFNLNRSVTSSEMLSIENCINDMITNNMVVHSSVLPLENAMKICGLRAVFGEVYPSEVRVVTIGAPAMDHIMENPASSEWSDFSVEFCGGLHVSNMKEAQKFIIIEEQAVAKGIRRIIGITGNAAIHAYNRGLNISQRLTNITESIQSLDTSKADHHVSLSRLSKELSALRVDIDNTVISLALKLQLREVCDDQSKILASQFKLIESALIDEVINNVNAAVTSRPSSDMNKTVLTVFYDGVDNSKCFKGVSDAIKKLDPELSYMLVIANKRESKISCFTFVSESGLKSGLDADKWLQSVIVPVGGRGGGKKVTSQGSVSDITVIDKILELARK